MITTIEEAILWLKEQGLYAVKSKRLENSLRASSLPKTSPGGIEYAENNLWIQQEGEKWIITILPTHSGCKLKYTHSNLDSAVKDAHAKILGGTRNLIQSG